MISYDQKIMLDPDVAVLIPPQVHFSTGAEAAFAHFFVHFNLSPCDLPPEQRMLHKVPAKEVILPYIRKNLASMSVQQRFWAASSVVQAALLRLPEETFHLCAEPEEYNIFDRAVDIIEKDLAFSKTAGELAALCGTSVNTLQRQFLSAAGVSVRKWLLNRKMEKAVHLLTVEKYSIKETAYMLGFADRYHFSKVFKNYFGTTPMHFIKSGGIPLP